MSDPERIETFDVEDWVLVVIADTPDVERLLEEKYWPPVVLRDELKRFKEVEVFDAQANAVTARFYVGPDPDTDHSACKKPCHKCWEPVDPELMLYRPQICDVEEYMEPQPLPGSLEADMNELINGHVDRLAMVYCIEARRYPASLMEVDMEEGYRAKGKIYQEIAKQNITQHRMLRTDPRWKPSLMKLAELAKADPQIAPIFYQGVDNRWLMERGTQQGFITHRDVAEARARKQGIDNSCQVKA